MNKIRLLLLTLFLAGFSAVSYSIQINETEALGKAQQFFSQKKTSLLRSTPNFQLIYACKDANALLRSTNAATYYYIFNVGENQGFVIVSGDDATKSILGYSTEGAFSMENMPDNLQRWLDFYKSEIRYSLENELSAKPLEQATTTQLSTGSVAPLLGNIKWNQESPFNYLCPVNPTTKVKAPTGCVATAMAQIMKYYQWPVTGTGSNS